MGPSDRLLQLVWDHQWILPLAPRWLCSDPEGWHSVGEDTALPGQWRALAWSLSSPVEQPWWCCSLTLSFSWLSKHLVEQFPQQFPIWGFWFHKNNVFLGNKLVPLQFWRQLGRQRGFPPTPCMPAGITVGKWAACPPRWTSRSSGLPNYPASHLADCSNCLASWLASHLGSQLPVQKFLQHALCGLKMIIRFCARKLHGKEKFSLLPKRKTEIKK